MKNILIVNIHLDYEYFIIALEMYAEWSIIDAHSTNREIFIENDLENLSIKV